MVKPCTFQIKGLAFVLLLEDDLEALGTACLMKVSLYTWGLGPGQIVHADHVIYGGDLGLLCISLTSGEAGVWVTRVSPTVTPCPLPWPPRHQGLGELPGWRHSACVVTRRCWDNWALSQWSHLEVQVDASTWTLPCAPLSLADFFLYPFTVINFVTLTAPLSSVRPPSRSSNLRVVLGTPDISSDFLFSLFTSSGIN